jgi:endonuclease YncB( thermonuclease family)
MHVYPAVVVRVIDGDTVRLSVDVGFRMRFEDNFRLQGINAEEGKSTTAADRVRTLLPVGCAVVVSTSKPEKFGRWMADIAIPEVSTSICELLVSEELAVQYSGGKR